MACTLLATPSVGVSDWSNFITQVEYQRRGFMAVTYTNFAASAESAIAAGSIIEVAGSVYQFTETAIDYTGGGSVSSDLYIYVKPDAVISTATVVAWGSAPVWVDAKQGFYASAASVTRAMGGMYVGTAATYYNKYLYMGNHLQDCLERNSTRPFLRTVLNLGEWNMDTTLTKTLSLSSNTFIKVGTIMDVGGVIVDDNNSVKVSIYNDSYGSTGSIVTSYNIANQNMVVGRITGGYFDSIDYDATAATVANRGTIIIEYEA